MASNRKHRHQMVKPETADLTNEQLYRKLQICKEHGRDLLFNAKHYQDEAKRRGLRLTGTNLCLGGSKVRMPKVDG